MAKFRVYELAKELNMDSKELVEKLISSGMSIKNYMSTLDEAAAIRAKDIVSGVVSEVIENRRIKPTVIRRLKKIKRVELEIPTGKIEEKIEQLKQELERRCSEAGLQRGQVLLSSGKNALMIDLPAGRRKKRLIIEDISATERIIEIPFENYHFLSDYEAICSYKEGLIEASIGLVTHEAGLQPELLDHDITATHNVEGNRIKIVLTTKSEHLETLLSLCSESPTRPTLFLKIQGLRVDQHDKAVEYLEDFANSVFFQIDFKTHLPLQLRRFEKTLSPSSSNLDLSSIDKLQFPVLQYAKEPIDLYWLARSLNAFPSLQYLAFYQVIEFYFPIYFRKEATREIRRILKTPGFSPDNDTDIVKLLTVDESTGPVRDERTQLKATLTECISIRALKKYLTSNQERQKWFTDEKGKGGKAKKLSEHMIPINDKATNITAKLTERIYEIRCKIVHTKTGLDWFIPFSEEASFLENDIELIRYIASDVLINNSREFKL
jgi:hypothetical protein